VSTYGTIILNSLNTLTLSELPLTLAKLIHFAKHYLTKPKDKQHGLFQRRTPQRHNLRFASMRGHLASLGLARHRMARIHGRVFNLEALTMQLLALDEG
jgi:hypothetical protein